MKDEVKDMPIMCVMFNEDGSKGNEVLINPGEWDKAMMDKVARCLYGAFVRHREKEKERKGDL